MLVIGFSRLRPFLISTYNFRFIESNFGLVDLKITILKSLKFTTGVSKFGKNADLFVIGFSKPIFDIYVQFPSQ